LGGDRPLAAITEAICMTYRDFVLSRCQPSTFNIARRHLNVIFNAAVREKYIPQSPFHFVPPAMVPKKPPRRITMTDLQDALDILETKEVTRWLKNTWFWSTVMKTLYFTGMRCSQLLKLIWSDIDFKSMTIRLRSETSKNKREWEIPLPMKLHQPLLEMRRKAMGVTVEAVKAEASVFNYSLFCARTKRVWGLTYTQLRKFFTDLHREIGVKISAHRVRHTTASEMMKKTRNPKVVQQQLGHTDLATTMIYVHVDLDDARSLVDQL
jgi:integrase